MTDTTTRITELRRAMAEKADQLADLALRRDAAPPPVPLTDRTGAARSHAAEPVATAEPIGTTHLTTHTRRSLQ